jgi:NAD-dependent deacetylase
MRRGAIVRCIQLARRDRGGVCMTLPRPADGSRIVILAGAGLSAASDIPPWRDREGSWEGRPVEQITNFEAWNTDRELVERFYDRRRLDCTPVSPNAAHEALVRLQHRWGSRRVVLVSQALDGLLHKAGVVDVIEMYGTLWRQRCEADPEHPHCQVAGAMQRRRCAVCDAPMRPDVVWPEEPIRHRAAILAAAQGCSLFLAIGASGLADPTRFESGLLALAAPSAETVEVNLEPSGAAFDRVIRDPADEVVPRMVAAWLGE